MTPLNVAYEVKISPGQLKEFLKIDAQRLRMWYQAGIFGEAARTSGRGHPREYSFADVVTARVVQEILDLTKSKSMKVIAMKDLICEIPGLIAEILNDRGVRIYKQDGSENKVCLFVLRWDRNVGDWRGSLIRGGNEVSVPLIFDSKLETPPQAVIIIRLSRIIEEVQQYFERGGVDVRKSM